MYIAALARNVEFVERLLNWGGSPKYKAHASTVLAAIPVVLGDVNLCHVMWHNLSVPISGLVFLVLAELKISVTLQNSILKEARDCSSFPWTIPRSAMLLAAHNGNLTLLHEYVIFWTTHKNTCVPRELVDLLIARLQDTDPIDAVQHFEVLLELVDILKQGNALSSAQVCALTEEVRKTLASKATYGSGELVILASIFGLLKPETSEFVRGLMLQREVQLPEILISKPEFDQNAKLSVLRKQLRSKAELNSLLLADLSPPDLSAIVSTALNEGLEVPDVLIALLLPGGRDNLVSMYRNARRAPHPLLFPHLSLTERRHISARLASDDSSKTSPAIFHRLGDQTVQFLLDILPTKPPPDDVVSLLTDEQRARVLDTQATLHKSPTIFQLKLMPTHARSQYILHMARANMALPDGAHTCLPSYDIMVYWTTRLRLTSFPQALVRSFVFAAYAYVVYLQ